MAASLEKNKQASYSSASSALTISKYDPTCIVDDEGSYAEEAEKDTAFANIEVARELEIGEQPDGGLKAWLVVIGVSFYLAHRALEQASMPCSNPSVFGSDAKLRYIC